MLVFGLVRAPSAMRGVVVLTQFFLHTTLAHPFTMAFSVPHLHAEGLIILGGQGRTSSRINVDVVMREIMGVSLCEKKRLTAALVNALAIVQTIRTLAYCSRAGQHAHNRKVLGGPAYNAGAPKRTKTRTTMHTFWPPDTCKHEGICTYTFICFHTSTPAPSVM